MVHQKLDLSEVVRELEILNLERDHAKAQRGLKGLKPVYLIFGSEKLLLEEALDRLKARFAKEAPLDFNYVEFRGGEDSTSTMVQAAQTVPFLSHRRLVVVKDADKLSPSEVSFLSDYLKNPSEHACLVLVAGKLDKSDRLYKAIEKFGEIHEYKLLFRDYPNWIKKQFLKKGKVATKSAAEFLFQTIGQDLNRLANEIEKISLFYDDKRELDIEDINYVTGKTPEETIFDLMDFISRRDEAHALSALDCLLKGGETITRIYHMIIRQFRLLLKAKVLLERGANDQQLMRELKLPSFVVERLKRQCRNFSFKQLKRAHELLLEADLDMKSSDKNPRLILETLVVKILE
ncbi:MAG: DNA polymerase III subunit delta [Actinomycetota bacterium]|nr:DNA polymerase III subunit delta [Actinomycetota bacterium]